MRSRREAVCAAVLTAALALAACTGGGGGTKSTTSATVPPPATTSAAPTTPPPTTPKPTPAKTTVPVDQIPPGNPTSWVPAGVPTTAKYKEPGDVVPRFTRTMFSQNEEGALALMNYYYIAMNWDSATGYAPTAYTIICPSACSQEANNSARLRSRHQHISGARFLVRPPVLVRAGSKAKSGWSGQFAVTVTAGAVRNSANKLVKRLDAVRFTLQLDAQWTGKMWQIARTYYVQ